MGDYFGRLGNFWFPDGWKSAVWLLCAAMPLYFFQTFIHEGTHAFASFCVTGDFPLFAPFPHYNSAFKGFLNGVALTGGHGFVAWPQFFTLILIIGLSCIFIFWPITGKTARTLLRTWYLGLCVDLLYNTVKGLAGASSPSSDWGKLQADIGTGGIIALSWIIWISVVIGHFVWVYFSAWNRDRIHVETFWEYRWLFLILAIFSMVAILFSIAVNNSIIIKSGPHGGIFIAFLTLQCFWLVSNTILFGLSFRFLDRNG